MEYSDQLAQPTAASQSDQMKLNSKYFDSIRIKSKAETGRKDHVACEWPGCTADARHRAPKGRNAEGQYFNFCVDHVRSYNKSYNYFDGMGDSDIGDWIKASATGHRPTWKLGENSWAEANRTRQRKKTGQGNRRGFRHDAEFNDPHRMFNEHANAYRGGASSGSRPVRNAERKALDTLGLEPGVSAQEIKAQYKQLVKRFHPDANGGSRATEERFREIVQAYDYLKSSGVC
jgi:hypothetical protein